MITKYGEKKTKDGSTAYFLIKPGEVKETTKINNIIKKLYQKHILSYTRFDCLAWYIDYLIVVVLSRPDGYRELSGAVGS